LREPYRGAPLLHHAVLRLSDVCLEVVVVVGPHRGDAFAACEFIMDYLKTRAPFWKKEQTPQGARWVDARATDDDAAERWDGPRKDVA